MYRSSLQDEADYNHALEYAAEKAAEKAARIATEKATREVTEKATREATEKAVKVATYLITNSDLSNQKIAEAAGLEESAVETIRKNQRRQ